MYNLVINGCLGRMGQEVAKQSELYEDLNLVAGIDITENIHSSFPVYSNINNLNEKIDIIIDFSRPESTLNVLEFAKNKQIAVVIATTGFSKEQEDIIKEYSKFIPVFKSANMSFDINLMCKIVAEVANMLPSNDIEIIETHHNKKIDAPSGTALLLADSINKALDNKMRYVYNRHDIHEKRNQNEIGISSIRGGNIVGEHTVQFFGPFETFEIKHTSYSRSVFADGALKAACFIVNKDVGFYTMNDLI